MVSDLLACLMAKTVKWGFQYLHAAAQEQTAHPSTLVMHGMSSCVRFW